MKNGVRIAQQGKVTDLPPGYLADTRPQIDEVDPKGALIQALNPPALDAVGEHLTAEVSQFVGPR